MKDVFTCKLMTESGFRYVIVHGCYNQYAWAEMVVIEFATAEKDMESQLYGFHLIPIASFATSTF